MQVIKQLKVKFVYSMIFIEMFVFATILLTLNVTITRRESNETKEFLVFLANNNGHSPRPRLFNDKMIPRQKQNELLMDIDATSSASRKRPEDFLYNDPQVLEGRQPYAEYRKAQAEMRQAVAVKANIDHLLGHTDGRENKAQER